MTVYYITPFELYNVNEGIIKLNNNKIYQNLQTLRNHLTNTKNKMDPYFNKYKYVFRSAISNFEPFKELKIEITERWNTPNVTNTWIIEYEIYDKFQLIPEFVNNKWTSFHSVNLPASNIFALYHYIHTHRDENFQSKFHWLASAPVNNKKYKGDSDNYRLVENYPNNWCINFQDQNANGDITNVQFTEYVKKWIQTKNKVNLFIGNIEINIGKDFNNEETKYNKSLLAQIYLGLSILTKHGNAVFRNLTFFTPFNISMIAWLKQYFDEFIIYKPVSSKRYSSEIFFICKNFKGISDKNLFYIKTILQDESFDYKQNQIFPLEKIKKTSNFWNEINMASAIFKKQIININNGISDFVDVVRRANNESERILRDSSNRYRNRNDKEIDMWLAEHKILLLHNRKHMKNIRSETRYCAENNNRFKHNNSHDRYNKRRFY